MKSIALWLITLAALLAAGCGTPHVPPAGEPAVKTEKPHVPPAGEPSVKKERPRPVSDVESLLVYFEYVRRLPAADLAKEHDAVRLLYARSGSDINRVRYAAVLSVPGAAFSDEAHALEVLDPLLKNPGAPLHNLAFVVGAQIQEQRRAQGLQQKLEALKSLEKNLLERGR